MFIPVTTVGEMKRKLQEMEAANNIKKGIKYVETTGPNIQNKPFRVDPWKQGCGRQDCLMCKGEEKDRGRCMAKNVLYRIDCLHCKAQEKTTTYIGESARTGYERWLEHKELIDQKSEESPVVEHHLEAHPTEDQIMVAMKVIRKVKKPLDRLTLEGTLITEFSEGNLMNRKGEWGQNLPPIFDVLDDETEAGMVEKEEERVKAREG